jgi:hypothetical protein
VIRVPVIHNSVTVRTLLSALLHDLPGGRHMETAREGAPVLLDLNDNGPENCCRPAADVLFCSVAQCYQNGALGLCSPAWATRECSAHAAAEAGLAQAVLPIEEPGVEVMRRVQAHG